MARTSRGTGFWTAADMQRFVRTSVNKRTGESYVIPEPPVDGEGIDRFLEQNPGKQVVVVQGLGFVGAVMATVCANAHGGDYAVIGVDLANEDTYWRIRCLNEGVFPISADDPKIEAYFHEARRRSVLYATFDPYAYSRADVIIVDVNLDVTKKSEPDGSLCGYDVDLTGFRRAIETIGRNCRPDVLVVVESTVPPGTCKEVVVPTIRRCLRERGLPHDRVRIGHSFERVMPGPDYIDSIQSFYRAYSGIDAESADATGAFLKTIIRTEDYPLTRLNSTSATEIAKVLENSYRAMNIAFVVEWTRLAEEAGVNLYEIVNSIRLRSTHANLMYPGIGVGGYCLPKDPLLASWARRNLLGGRAGLEQSEIAVSINDQMPRYAFEYLKRVCPFDLRGRTVLLLGVAYRGDVGDTRYTPIAPFYDLLLDAGATILLHDPYVAYWEEKAVPVEGNAGKLLARNPHVLVLSVGHSMYRTDSFADALMDCEGAFVFDTMGILSQRAIARLLARHTVKVLGRGDL
jgi:UDP-N-acetyl-D-glucosamine dehydrogenase